MKMELNNKVALITGGCSGIGLGYTTALLKHNIKGVALLDILDSGEDVVKELNGVYNNRAIFVNCDVTKEEQLDYAFEKTAKHFNQLDIVINNAGILDESDWKRTININLIGVICGTLLAKDKYLPKYRKGPEGIILNTASIAAIDIYDKRPFYSASKQGVVAFSRAIGGDIHYKDSKIRVLTICPGGTDTALVANEKKKRADPSKSSNRIIQSTEHIAECMLGVLANGKSGSVWIVEDEEPVYQVKFFTRKESKV